MNQPEHHGREHALTGIGLFVEMLALLFGEYWLGLGAAVFLWLAVLNYTRSYTTKWKPVYQNDTVQFQL
jgi:hypothetical protein